MSSEQFSESPLPAKRKARCPHCGAAIVQGAVERCWMCGEDLPPMTDAITLAAHIRESSMGMPPVPGGDDNAAFAAIGILSVLLIGGLMLVAPGILIVLLILAVPALIRTLALSARSKDQIGAASGPMTFISSLGIMILIGIASFAAFFTTCFVVCLGGLGINDRDLVRSTDWIWVASIGAGFAPGLFVAVVLFKKLWPRKG